MIDNVDPEGDPARFTTKICEFRMGDGVILDERFECEHPEAEIADNYSEFCEPRALRSPEDKKS